MPTLSDMTDPKERLDESSSQETMMTQKWLDNNQYSRWLRRVKGVSAKTWRHIKTPIVQSWYLKSGHLYSYVNDSCLLTKTKLKIETFNLKWIINEF